MYLEYGLKELSLLTDRLSSYMIGNRLIILLQGDLSSGKTALVKQFVHNFDSSIIVTSPTFTIMHEYTIPVDNHSITVYHYDLYRKKWQELLIMGFLDMIDKSGIHCIEWSNQQLEELLKNTTIPVVTVQINILTNDKRGYTIRSVNTKVGNESA